jgi:hypothetical protein
MAYVPCKHLRLEEDETFRKGHVRMCCAPLPEMSLSNMPFPVTHSFQWQEFRRMLAVSTDGLGWVEKSDCAKCPCYSPREAK